MLVDDTLDIVQYTSDIDEKNTGWYYNIKHY